MGCTGEFAARFTINDEANAIDALSCILGFSLQFFQFYFLTSTRNYFSCTMCFSHVTLSMFNSKVIWIWICICICAYDLHIMLMICMLNSIRVRSTCMRFFEFGIQCRCDW